MAKLEAILEQRGIATPREISEAIARCQLHGGDLTTSLLQFVNADEALLSVALSEAHGLAAATVGLLPAPDDAALRSLPRDVAERYCCFPLEAGPGRLVLAVAHPLEAALHDELGLTLGVVIEQRVALEVRIRQALARFYGLPLSARNQRGISRLEGDVEGVGHETPLGLWSDTQLSSSPRTPSDLPQSQRDSQRPPSVRPRTRSETPRYGSGAPPPSPSRRRGPLSLAQAREELGRAPSRNEVLDIFFNFASQYFEYSALFAVHNALAEGLDAWGKGADRDTVLGIGVPLDLPSSLSEAAESCKVRLTRLGKEGIDRTLMADLQRQFNGKALVLPVSLRGRCAVLLYADNGEADVVEREVADVVAIAGDVANALGRIILQRKKQRAPEQADLSGSNVEQRSLPPQGAPNGALSLRSDAIDLPEPLPSENRDRSRNNARRGSRPEASPAPLSSDHPGVQTQPVVAIGANTSPTSPARPSSPPSASSSALSPASSPAPGQEPSSESSSGDEPVFLLARPHGQGGLHALPSEPRSAFASTVQRPPVSITLPAPIIGNRPRLPSVIVDPESADPEASERATRAGAVTRAPSQARSAMSMRRPAVPPPADAPRTVGPPPDEKLAAAPMGASIDNMPVRVDAVDHEATLGEDLGEVVEGGDPTLSAEEALGATAWPPPIMDNSPPPRQPPLTALVPIIIADSPKGRRGYIAARGPNVGRGTSQAPLARAGARPSSNPAGGSHASPTVPSPARTRRLDPGAAALAPAATPVPSEVAVEAARGGASTNPPTDIAPTLGEAVLAATTARPEAVAGSGNGAPPAHHATALARAAARSSSTSHAPLEPEPIRAPDVRAAEPPLVQRPRAKAASPLITPQVDIGASPIAAHPFGEDRSSRVSREAGASASPSGPPPRHSGPPALGASLTSRVKTAAPHGGRVAASAVTTPARAVAPAERTIALTPSASSSSPSALDASTKDISTKDLAGAETAGAEVAAAATGNDTKSLPTPANVSVPPPASLPDTDLAPESGLSDLRAWPDPTEPPETALDAAPAPASAGAVSSTPELEATPREASIGDPAPHAAPATVTRASREVATRAASGRDPATPAAPNREAPNREAPNREAGGAPVIRETTTLEAATLEAVTRAPTAPSAGLAPSARISSSPATQPASSWGRSADSERAPDSGLSDLRAWPDPEPVERTPFASRPASISPFASGPPLGSSGASPSTRPVPSSSHRTSPSPSSPFASGPPLGSPSASPSTRPVPSSSHRTLPSPSSPSASGPPSESPRGASSTPSSVSSPPGAVAAGVRPAIFPPPHSDTDRPGDTEIEALVDRVCQGNLKAVQDLARIGAPTLPQLMARFPGPVISERAGPTSRASECGPLLQALAAIGSPATPSITHSSQNEDARVRRWATLLLGEMPGPEACRAVVQRLADDVPRVHQAALDAARLLLAGPAADLFRKTLFEVAEAEEAPLTLRLRTLEHVAKLKDSASVPRLIAFLGADMEPIVHKALWALTVVTRHDFGRDSKAWSDFWHSQQSRHRLEWLIDALDDRDPRLRKAALDELREETSDSFGYAENLAQRERVEAQARFRSWWETSGAARHGRGV